MVASRLPDRQTESIMTSHIALIGDSIFDNRAYIGGAPDVVAHLRAELPAPWRATLCAVDGSTGRPSEATRECSGGCIPPGHLDRGKRRDPQQRSTWPAGRVDGGSARSF